MPGSDRELAHQQAARDGGLARHLLHEEADAGGGASVAEGGGPCLGHVTGTAAAFAPADQPMDCRVLRRRRQHVRPVFQQRLRADEAHDGQNRGEGGKVACLAGLLVGVVNGVGVALLGIPPLVATLAVASVVNGGLIVGVSSLKPADAASSTLVWLAGRATAGVPNVVVLWAVIAAAAVWLLSRSAWGRQLRGTGSNPTVALLSGTRVLAVRVAAYALSGLLAGFSGFLLTGYVGQAFLGLGNAYVLTSIVTAAVGGVTLAGGRAPYAGVAAAAVMLTVLVSLLTAVNIGEAGRQVAFGATLLVFLALDRIVAGRPGRL